jgi:hypothetical protein
MIYSSDTSNRFKPTKQTTIYLSDSQFWIQAIEICNDISKQSTKLQASETLQLPYHLITITTRSDLYHTRNRQRLKYVTSFTTLPRNLVFRISIRITYKARRNSWKFKCTTKNSNQQQWIYQALPISPIAHIYWGPEPHIYIAYIYWGTKASLLPTANYRGMEACQTSNVYYRATQASWRTSKSTIQTVDTMSSKTQFYKKQAPWIQTRLLPLLGIRRRICLRHMRMVRLP